jgi:predicted RNase H-like HicB family nuclease
MKYVYAAVFNPEGNAYNVYFPDLPGCCTCGDNLEDAVDMVQDALCMWLYHLEEEKRPVPVASHPKNIEASGEDFVMAISVDTDDYRRFYENKLVKKNLNIPSWLNAKAEAANVNFSQVLQRALKAELNLTTE